MEPRFKQCYLFFIMEILGLSHRVFLDSQEASARELTSVTGLYSVCAGYFLAHHGMYDQMTAWFNLKFSDDQKWKTNSELRLPYY